MKDEIDLDIMEYNVIFDLSPTTKVRRGLESRFENEYEHKIDYPAVFSWLEFGFCNDGRELNTRKITTRENKMEEIWGNIEKDKDMAIVTESEVNDRNKVVCGHVCIGRKCVSFCENVCV